MSASTTGETVIILGATGAVGRAALASLLNNPSVSTVHSFGRTAPTLSSTSTASTSKLIHKSLDFDALLTSPPSASEAQKLREVRADSVLIALGTTRASAGSFDNFRRIDKEFVLAAAKEAKVEGKEQTLVYCSSGGASSGSFLPYPKSKGQTEEGLASLGYADTIIFRPGMLIVPEGRGPDHRMVESLAAKVTGVISYVYNIEIKTPVVGAAMVRAAIEGSKAIGVGKSEKLNSGATVWAINNNEATKLGSA